MKRSSNSLNLLSLTVIQGANSVLPLVVFPYTLKVVGSEFYAKLAISEAIMFVAFTFVLYSFEITGVFEIARLKDKFNSDELSKIFTKILISRLFIFFICILILLLTRHFWDTQLFKLILYWLLFPLSYILQSNYFFQGIEENIFLACSVVFSRILTISYIFKYVNKTEDVYLVPLIIGLTYLAGSIATFIYAICKFKLYVSRVSVSAIKNVFYGGKEIFFGNVSVLMFKDSNVLMLGMFLNDPVLISAYSVAEKLIKSLQAMLRPLNQFFFPKAIKLIAEVTLPNKKSFLLLSKITVSQILLSIIMIIIFMIIFSFFEGKILLLKNFPNIETVKHLSFIMIFSITIGVSNFMYGSVGLNYLNSKQYFAKSIFITGIIGIFLSALLINMYQAVGAAVSFVLTETILFVMVMNKYNE